MLQKYTAQSTKSLRWHDGETSPVGANSIVETDTTNIVVLGGVSYIAEGSQVNVLINTAGPVIGIGETEEDLPVKAL
jgi:hypothetical protein